MVSYPPICKIWSRVAPNLIDYEQACRSFSWDQARGQLTGLPSGGLNMAFEAVTRHASTAIVVVSSS